MTLKDDHVFYAPTSVVIHNDIAKERRQFAVKYSRWGTHYCSCKVTVQHMTLTLVHTLIHAGSNQCVYYTKKFFAEEVMSQTATHFKVRNYVTNRIHTIKKDDSSPCMIPNQYYRDKQTGE